MLNMLSPAQRVLVAAALQRSHLVCAFLLGTSAAAQAVLATMDGARAVAGVSIPAVNACFLGVAAAFHLTYAAAQEYLKLLSPRLRYLEFLLTMPLVLGSLALLVGVRSAAKLAAIAALQTVTTCLAYLDANATRGACCAPRRAAPAALGAALVTYAAEWVIIFEELLAGVAARAAPAWVIALTLVLFATSTLYGANQAYFLTISRARGREPSQDDELEMDGVFHLLSLATKLSLVWVPVLI